QTQFDESTGVFSPNVQWIAYVSNETGTRQVYVQSFPASGGKWEISTQGGDHPRWSRDGKELFFLAPDGRLMATDVKASASNFEAGVPKALFEIHGRNSSLDFQYGISAEYAIGADSQRFLLNLAVEESTATPFTVVTNWAAELRQ